MDPHPELEEKAENALHIIEGKKVEFQKLIAHGDFPTQKMVEDFENAINTAQEYVNQSSEFVAPAVAQKQNFALLDAREAIAFALGYGKDSIERDWAIQKYDELLPLRERAQTTTDHRTCITRQNLAMLLWGSTNVDDKEKAKDLIVFNLRKGPPSLNLLRREDNLKTLEDVVAALWLRARGKRNTDNLEDLNNATNLAKRALSGLERSLGPLHDSTIDLRDSYVGLLLDRAQHPNIEDPEKLAIREARKLATHNIRIIRNSKHKTARILAKHEEYVIKCDELLKREDMSTIEVESLRTPVKTNTPRLPITGSDFQGSWCPSRRNSFSASSELDFSSNLIEGVNPAKTRLDLFDTFWTQDPWSAEQLHARQEGRTANDRTLDPHTRIPAMPQALSEGHKRRANFPKQNDPTQSATQSSIARRTPRTISRPEIGLIIGYNDSHARPSDAHWENFYLNRAKDPVREWFDSHEHPFYTSSCEATQADNWQRNEVKIADNKISEGRLEGNERVKIAILDTGIDGHHPFLLPKPWGYDWGKRVKGFISFKRDPQNPGTLFMVEEKSWSDWYAKGFSNSEAYVDWYGHGTSCAGIILQTASNADIYVACVSDREQNQDIGDQQVAQAIKHAREVWDVQIISMSFGYDDIRRLPREISREIRASQNTLMLASAGNHGGHKPYIAFPASSDRVICVKSANGDGKGSGFNPSNSDPQLVGHNFMVLGEMILTITPAHTLSNGERKLQTRFTGTSASTPVAAAYAALILEFAHQEDDTSGGKPEFLTKCREKLKEDIYDGIKKIFKQISTAEQEGHVAGGCRNLNLTELFKAEDTFSKIAKRLAGFLDVEIVDD